MRFDLIFMMKDKYISSNLNPLKNALVAELASLFPPVEHLSNDHEDNSNQHRNNHKLCNETQDIPFFEFDRKSMETETTTQLEFPNRGKAIVEQILAAKEINKSKRAGL